MRKALINCAPGSGLHDILRDLKVKSRGKQVNVQLDLHDFGISEGYCHSDTAQCKTQKIYLLLGLEHRLHRVNSEAKVSKQTHSTRYISTK